MPACLALLRPALPWLAWADGGDGDGGHETQISREMLVGGGESEREECIQVWAEGRVGRRGGVGSRFEDRQIILPTPRGGERERETMTSSPRWRPLVTVAEVCERSETLRVVVARNVNAAIGGRDSSPTIFSWRGALLPALRPVFRQRAELLQPLPR